MELLKREFADIIINHIKLFLAVGFLAFTLPSQCQIFHDNSVFIIVGSEHESNFILKDSITMDSFKTDTLFYTLTRKIIKGDISNTYSKCQLTEIENKVYASLVTIDEVDTISQTLVHDFNLEVDDSIMISLPQYDLSTYAKIIEIVDYGLLNHDTVPSQVFGDLWDYYPLRKHMPILGSNTSPLGLFDYLLHKGRAPNSNFRMALVSCCTHDTLLFKDPEFVADTIDLNWCNSVQVVEKLLASTKKPNTYTIKVYPNPAISEVNIYLTPEMGNTGVIEVFGLQGQLVESQDIAPTTVQKLSVNDLETGVYWIKIKTNVGVFTHQIKVD